MNTIDLQAHVRHAIQEKWETFARLHPNLAQVIDQELLVEQATRSIADDPEFRETMLQAQALAIGANAVVPVIERIVERVLRALL